MPAQAGIQTSSVVPWMPACAGMTIIVLILIDLCCKTGLLCVV
jgi:hypothetical protein